jgi:predicted molibdopterin-dependent oxidoreductase YjgC
VIPRDNEAINECWISDRDRFGLNYVDSEARLTQPLVRRGETLQPATWDEALQLVTDKLKGVASTQVAAIGSGKLTNEGALAMATLFKEGVGTPHVSAGFTSTITTPGKTTSAFYEELEAADVILVVGSNPNEELPILDLRLKKAAFQRGANLININAWKTPLDRVAKQSFLHNEGSEVALLNGLAKLVHQSWNDEPAQSEKLHAVAGADAKSWVDALAPYASTRVAEIAGVDEESLRTAATAIANSERLFILVGENAAPETLAALNNLASLKGRNDYLVVLHPEANAVGVRRAGLQSENGGLSGERILEATAKGDVKVLYIAANNPLRNAADFDVARRALEAAEFIVVQSLFLNELTEHADVVLPAATFMEQEGTTTNFAGKVQTLKQVFRPRERRDSQGNTLSACAPDWIIFTKLLQLLGKDQNILNVSGWTQRFRTLPISQNASASFVTVNYEASPAALPEGSLRLLSGPVLYDGGDSFPHCERLNLVTPEPFVAIHRSDARKLGIENGATVEVKSIKGRVRVLAKVGRNVKEGTVWMPRRLRDVQINQLIDAKAPFNAVTITKVADATVKSETAGEYAASPSQGAVATSQATNADAEELTNRA